VPDTVEQEKLKSPGARASSSPNGSTDGSLTPSRDERDSTFSVAASCDSPSDTTISQRDWKDACKLHPGAQRRPPPWLDAVMRILYPASLGLDEGIAHLTMKASLAMFGSCLNDIGIEQCNHWAVYVSVFAWVGSSMATLWWLQIVYRRYETTLALPIEYGFVNVAATASGLLAYDEIGYMETWQISLAISGALIVLVGIFVGRLHSYETNTVAQSSQGEMELEEVTVLAPITMRSIKENIEKSFDEQRKRAQTLINRKRAESQRPRKRAETHKVTSPSKDGPKESPLAGTKSAKVGGTVRIAPVAESSDRSGSGSSLQRDGGGGANAISPSPLLPAHGSTCSSEV